jgi:hypothetical protein
MSEPQSARTRFQIHGFTVLVLLGVASGLLWANCKSEISPVNPHVDYMDADIYFGWPATCVDYTGPHYSKRNQLTYGWAYFKVNWSYFAFDFLVAMILLILTWQVCEGLIRILTASKRKQ